MRPDRKPKAPLLTLTAGLCSCFLLLMVSTAQAPAQSAKRPMTVDDQFRLVEPGNPLLSPDGQWVIYTIERTSLAENARHKSSWLASTNAGIPSREFLREGDASPMWASDSRSIFFLRSVTNGEKKSRELYEQRIKETVAVQQSHLGPGP